MSTIPSKAKLDEYVKMGLVRSQTHPTLPLTIYVYTETTSFERLWNNVTMACRGLVVDDKSRCVVRCLPKFFNEEEPHAVCELDFSSTPVVFNKLDGSLIQVVNDEEYGLVVTSKGSFASDQAEWAKELVEQQYSPGDFIAGETYVFELIHPMNRIVLDYGGVRDLFLLAIIDTETGVEADIYADKFNKFSKVTTVDDQEKHMAGLVEGVVVKTGSHRYKVKTGEYLRLHRIVTEFTPKRVWEALRDGDSLEFKNMPEEFDKWLQDTVLELKNQYGKIEEAVRVELKKSENLTPKELGLSQDYQYKGLLFTLRNGKSIDEAIWKMVKPKKEEIST